MHTILKNLELVKNEIKEIVDGKQLKSNPEIIAVSKTFPLSKITPLIDNGHIHFGENKVQEAQEKWSGLLDSNKKIKLHMLGKLQSNKAKIAVQVFDYIHSLDSVKLAKKISYFEKEFNKKTKLFIQVNIGEENQKSGIPTKDAKDFLKYCVEEAKLNILGLMVIPPNDENTSKYFQQVSNLNSELGVKELSMGMSSDYKLAIKFKATFLRIGSEILGPRGL